MRDCIPARATLLGVCLALATFAVPAAAQGKGKPAPKTPGADVAERDYYFLRDDLIRNKNGTLTWLYVTNHVGSTVLKSSIDQLKLPGVATSLRKRDSYQFSYDIRQARTNYANPPRRTQVTDENVLMLTFQEEFKDIVEEFVERFDVPDPQVYIKAKVVEVTLDSNLEYGVSWFFDRGAGDAGTGSVGSENPNSFFRSARSQFRPGSFTNAVLSPENTGLSLLFDSITTDEGTLFAAIEALRERGSANILSEPSIVATQGQLASIVTGQETPIIDVSISGSTERLATKFKETGIKLDFRPLHIGREYVKLRVRVEVSSITGFQVVESATTRVSNPVIAQRNAETVVTIRDGMTLVIGGLYSLSEIQDRAGVPLLADIPVLRYLFSTTKKTKVKSELDFFITPTILRQRLSKSVFVPPMERRRLAKLRKEREGSASGSKTADADR